MMTHSTNSQDQSLPESNDAQQSRTPSTTVEDRQIVSSTDPVPKVECDTQLESDQCTSWKIIVLMVALNLATFAAAVDNTIVATAIPTITSEFNSLGDVGWYGSIYMLTMTPFQPTLGKIYSMFNVKCVYIAALVIFEVGSIVGGSAKCSSMLISGRAIAGLGATAVFSGGMAIVANIVPERKRPLHIAFLQSMFGSANMIGPLLGGLLTEKASWRWCFWINVPFGILIALTVLFCFDEHRYRPKSIPRTFQQKLLHLDIPGSVLLISSLTCLLLALEWGGTISSWSSTRIICLLVSFAVLLCAFVVVQYVQPQNATIPLYILSRRSVSASGLYVFFLTMGRFTHMYYLAFYFQTCRGASAIGSGLRILPYFITATSTTIVSGILISRTGFYTPVMLAGAALFTVGSGLISLLRVDTSASQWIGYQLLAGMGAGAGVQTPYISAQAAADPSNVHTANAIVMFGTSLGGALSVSIAQNVFASVLLNEMPKYTSATISGTDILEMGGTQLRDASKVPPDQLATVLQVFSRALDSTFVIPIVAGCICVLLALAIEHKRLPGKLRLADAGTGTTSTNVAVPEG